MARSTWIWRGIIGAALAGVLAISVYPSVAAGQGRGRGGPGGMFGGPPMGPGGPMGRGGPGGGRFGGPLAELRGLDLTDDQRAQIKQLMDQHRDQTQPIAERAMTAHKAVRDAVQADTIDEAAIRARIAEAAAIDADLAVSEAHMRQSVLQLLTPEQLQKAKELRSRVQQRMQERMEGRQGRLERRHERIGRFLDAVR